MGSIYFWLVVLNIVTLNARRLEFDEYSMPIKLIETSYGVFDNERVEYLEAVILARHISDKEKIEFPTSGELGEKYVCNRYPGDERGGYIGSQFSGPPEWYNLTPYNARANRDSGYRALAPEWFKLECLVRQFLSKGSQGGERYVLWRSNMTYILNHNRPDTYTLETLFYHNDNVVDTKTEKFYNPYLKDDSGFWTCTCNEKRRRNPGQCKLL